MAKTYINTVKYQIKLKFEIDGIVDKPDIIGAIFGQSEGLLGDEMDLKELQKNGKVGRIEINHTTAMGRTKGEVIVPSSVDMAETSLLAAGIESVDKVGPCEAKFEIIELEDTRTDKRQEIKNRAQELLKKMMEKAKPESQSLGDELREGVRAAEITSYGPDKLPAGPDIETSEEIIVVEGRADVLNLLKNHIKNVIGMNGSNISPTIVELSRRKQIIAFVDGDRGGSLNARKLSQIAKVKYVCTAPDGKEVEELTRKEILQSLKKRIPPEAEFTPREFKRPFSAEATRPLSRRPMMDRRPERENFSRDGPPMRRPMDRDSGPDRRTAFRNTITTSTGVVEQVFDRSPRILTPEEEKNFKTVLDSLKGTMKAKILDENNKELKEVKVKDLVTEIGKTKKANAVVFDGVVTKRLVTAAEQASVKYVIGARSGKLEKNEKVKATAL